VEKRSTQDILDRVEQIERQVEQLKREIIRILAVAPGSARKGKPSLFGSVHAADITEEAIEDAKRSLFPTPEDRAVLCAEKGGGEEASLLLEATALEKLERVIDRQMTYYNTERRRLRAWLPIACGVS